MPEICGIIVPRREDILGYRNDEYLPVCIRPRCHSGPHVIKMPEGIYYAWEDDWSCGCCRPEEEDRCIHYWKIDEEDIPNL